jgi:Mor family transcriptional regulator
VPSPSYGLIVEGDYDIAVYGTLIRKIVPNAGTVIPRSVGGVTRLPRLLPSMLRDLEFVLSGRPVDKVMVIRDTNGKDATQLEDQLARRIHGQAFVFPRGTQFHATRRTVETWLLADSSAVNTVARSRRGRQISEVQGDLEEIEDPKGWFRGLLREAQLPYDPAVCQEVAAEIHLEKLRYRCPSFRSFETKVLDC